MYKPKIDNKEIEKGFILTEESKNSFSCNCINWNNCILDELKNIQPRKLCFEQSCQIVDFNFLNDFPRVEEINISLEHQKINIEPFNSLKSLKKLGVPAFTGIFSNPSVSSFSYSWENDCKFSMDLENLNEISIYHCNQFQTCLSEIRKLQKVHKLVLFHSNLDVIDNFSKFENVSEISFQFCKISSLSRVVKIFPNCKSWVLENTKGFDDYFGLKQLRDLENLEIISSSILKDLSFVSEIHSLKKLKVISTKIENVSEKDIQTINNVIFYLTGKDKIRKKW